MPALDRDRFIELLNQLGGEDNAAVVRAARELHRKVQEAGLGWDRLLRGDESSEALEEAAPAAQSASIQSAQVDRSDDMKVVDRLLARKGLSDTLRNDLTEFKRSIREGTLDSMDADYIRALAKRLDA